GSTISCGPIKMQPSALPNGEAERSIVLAYHCARGGVDDRSRSLAELTRQKAAGVAVGDEADVVRVRLASNGESPPRRFVAYLGLGRVADREHGVGELRRRQHSQDVRLVLTDVDRTHQTTVHQARVVTGDDGVEPEGEGAIEHGGKLDLLVTAQARVRGSTGGIFSEEVVDNVNAKSLGEIPDIERDIQ